MIIQESKNREGPADSKLPAVMNHIRKGKENDCRNGQDQDQEVTDIHHSIHFAYAIGKSSDPGILEGLRIQYHIKN